MTTEESRPKTFDDLVCACGRGWRDEIHRQATSVRQLWSGQRHVFREPKPVEEAS